MSAVSIMTGTGEGTLAKVSSDGSLEVEVANTVVTRRSDLTVYRTQTTAGITSSTLVNARAGRQGFHFRNQGANPVYLRFENSAATNQDWLVAPGGEFRGPDFPYEGIITVIAGGGSSNVLMLEMAP